MEVVNAIRYLVIEVENKLGMVESSVAIGVWSRGDRFEGG